jgi:hypothetical protein
VGITGLGGNGKTSLAIEVARDFRAMGFRYVVWQTASTKFNSTRMTFDSILENIPKQLLASLKDDVSNMDSLLDLIGLKGEIREIKTRELLSSQRVFLILDNMETSKSQNEIAARLSSVLGNSKVLFTSRNRFDTLEVDVWDYYLQGLQEEASIKLMEQVAQERDIPCFDSDSSGALLKLTGNNKTGYLPLALKLLTGQLKNKTIEEIEQSLFNVRITDDDVHEDNIEDNTNVFKIFWWRIFYQSFKMLSDSELKLMSLLAGLQEQEGTTYSLIRDMNSKRIKLTDQQLEQAIANNWRSCLLEREEYGKKRYYLHILTTKFFETILVIARGQIND